MCTFLQALLYDELHFSTWKCYQYDLYLKIFKITTLRERSQITLKIRISLWFSDQTRQWASLRHKQKLLSIHQTCVFVWFRSSRAPSNSSHHHAEGIPTQPAAFWRGSHPSSAFCLPRLPWPLRPPALRESQVQTSLLESENHRNDIRQWSSSIRLSPSIKTYLERSQRHCFTENINENTDRNNPNETSLYFHCFLSLLLCPSVPDIWW